MKRQRLTAWLAWLCGTVLLAFRSTYDVDVWWHIAQGRHALQGQPLHSNTLAAFHAQHPQTYTSWFFDAVAAWTWDLAGATGIQFLQAVLTGWLLWALWRACVRAGGGAWAPVATLVLGFITLESRVMPRPHLVSMALLATAVWLVEDVLHRKDARRLAWFIPLVAVWANTHAEAVLGAGLLGCVVLGSAVTRAPFPSAQLPVLGGITVAAGVALLATPYGTGLITYLRENGGVLDTIRIAELLPPTVEGHAFFVMYAVVLLVVALPFHRRTALWELLWCCALGYLAFQHRRFTGQFVVGTAPLLARRLGWWMELGAPRLAVLGVCGVVALVASGPRLAGLQQRLTLGDRALLLEEMLPVRGMEVARRLGLQGPVFCSNSFGGYVAFSMGAAAPVFQDSRLQAYPMEHFRNIMFSNTPAAWEQLTRDVDWAVLSLARPNEMSGVGRFSPALWTTVYLDESTQLLVRRTGRWADVATQHGLVAFGPGLNVWLKANHHGPNAAAISNDANRLLTLQPHHLPALAWRCVDGDGQACRDAWQLALEKNRTDVLDQLARGGHIPQLRVAPGLVVHP